MKLQKKEFLWYFQQNAQKIFQKAILTPGKIDRILSFKSPDYNARIDYIRHYAKDRAVLNNVDLEKLQIKNTRFFYRTDKAHFK